MEEENENLKLSVGFIGLTQEPETFNCFCLANPIIALLAYGIE